MKWEGRENVKEIFRNDYFKGYSPETKGVGWYGKKSVPIFVKARNLMVELAGTVQNKSVLDLGTGNGRIAIAFARAEAKKVLGVDISSVMVDTSTRNATGLDNIMFIVDDAEKLLNVKGKFDIICAMDLFIHLPHPSIALQRVKAHLRKNGRLIVNYSVGRYYSSSGLARPFTKEGFRALLSENEFRIVKEIDYGGPKVPYLFVIVVAKHDV